MSAGPVEIFLTVLSNSEDPSQPPELVTVPDDFYPLIGRIIIMWSTMEQELEVLGEALIAFNKTIKPGWLRSPFKVRWEFVREEWAKFAAGNQELLDEMAGISQDINLGKYLRDCIAHKRITMGIDQNGNFLRFQNDNKVFPWTKRFYRPDLSVADLALAKACGRLFRLTNVKYASYMSEITLEQLKGLPDLNELRFPLPKRKKPK